MIEVFFQKKMRKSFNFQTLTFEFANFPHKVVIAFDLQWKFTSDFGGCFYESCGEEIMNDGENF